MIHPPADSVRRYECERFAIDEVTYQSNNGQNISRPMVTHGGSVIILPVTATGDIVMIQNYRFTVNQKLWELPAGTLDHNEDSLECAKRELIEETGYQSQNCQHLFDFFPAPGMTNEKMHVFIAKDLTHVGQAVEDYEDIDVVIMPLTLAIQKIKSNEIIDGKTIAILLYYQMFLASQTD